MSHFGERERQRVYVATLGCRLNQADSDALERQARERGYQVVHHPALADLHIVNTCTITQEADADSRALVRRLHEAQGAPVVVTGCWATAAPQSAAALPGVIRVAGNAEKHRLFSELSSSELSSSASSSSALSSSPGAPDIRLGELHNRAAPLPIMPPALHPNRTRAYLKVQDGCDYKCSFCIVPQVRGPSRSIPVELLVQQARELLAAGQPEICLTGVHLGTYGRDLRPRQTLASLLAALLQPLGEFPGARLRLGSLDPHEVSEELIQLMAAHPQQICPYLHLPVQSGDDATLRRMRRAHTSGHLRETVARVSAALPHCGIGSDVIAGFPGETPQAFERTCQLLNELPLSYLHVFTYSHRPGTAAVSLDGQVPGAEKKRRTRVLRQLSARKQHAFATRLREHVTAALVLRKRHRHTGRLVAVTENYLTVQLEGPDAWRRRWINLSIDHVPELASLNADRAPILARGIGPA